MSHIHNDYSQSSAQKSNIQVCPLTCPWISGGFESWLSLRIKGTTWAEFLVDNFDMPSSCLQHLIPDLVNTSLCPFNTPKHLVPLLLNLWCNGDSTANSQVPVNLPCILKWNKSIHIQPGCKSCLPLRFLSLWRLPQWEGFYFYTEFFYPLEFKQPCHHSLCEQSCQCSLCNRTWLYRKVVVCTGKI